MAYAFSIAQIQTVKEAVHSELVAKAYLLTDSMFEDLGIKVTTDVENIDTCYIFSRQGLQARPYVVGSVQSSQLGKFVDNPVKVEGIVLHTSDSIERYKESGPFDVTNVAESAPHTVFLLNELSGRVAEDTRANVFFGNMANKSLPETAENQVKKGLSLFDGFYTIIAKRRTDGTISKANKNLIETGDITKSTPAKDVYGVLTRFYGGLSAALKKPEQKVYIYASDEFCRLAVKGYMETYPQIAPTVLNAGWKFVEMPNVVLVTSAAMGSGGQLIASVEDNLEYVCDNRENQALISIGQVNTDLRVFDYQANVRAAVRIRDFAPEVFATNDAVNTFTETPGDYIADIFSVASSDEKEGTVAITGGVKEIYAAGDVITVTATAKEGFVFAGWSDGGTENPYNYKFKGGIETLTAQFEEALEAEGAGQP